MRWRRTKIEVVEFEDADHSFFNFNVSDRHYEWSVSAADRVLVELGILEIGRSDESPVGL
jgi:hypothetical protein